MQARTVVTLAVACTIGVGGPVALAAPAVAVVPRATATSRPTAYAGDAVVTMGRQDSGPPAHVVHGANSTGAANRAQLLISGLSFTDVVVVFPGIGGPGGTVTLSPVGGTEPPACAPLRWVPWGTDERVTVRCNTNALQSATVHVSFTRATHPTGSFAYAFADQPSARSYVPTRTTQFATSGRPMTVTRLAPGQYQVRVPSVLTADGSVQVTAVGPQLATCSLVSWKPTGTGPVSDELVRVNCGPQWSAPSDSAFTLTYTARQDLLGMGRGVAGWVRVSAASARTTTPPQWSRYDGIMQVRRTGIAHYVVTGAGLTAGVTCTAVPDLPTPTPFLLHWVGGFVQLTNVGTSEDVCTLGS